MNNNSFSPLVVGLPRSGFSLLASVLIHIFNLVPNKFNYQCKALRVFSDTFGLKLSADIIRVFQETNNLDKLIFNGNFRKLAGGPIWNNDELGNKAYFRKYIGVKGQGDFTLLTSHPIKLLDQYEIVHSHGPFNSWLSEPTFKNYDKFASIRNPAGIINSACHSINALASEYMQLMDIRDQETVRINLASYKLTDIKFFDALLQPLKRGLLDQIDTFDSFYNVYWEEMVTDPQLTIKKVAIENGIKISDEQINNIWEQIGFRNLTGDHKHNYRPGKAYVGDERESLINEHIEIMKSNGFDDICKFFGYSELKYFNENDYTVFQQKTSKALKENKILDPTRDRHLFDLAFNKSNLDFTQFDFRTYEWGKVSRLERSNLVDDKLELAVFKSAEQSILIINELLQDLLDFLEAKSDFERFKNKAKTLNTQFDMIDCEQALLDIELLVQ